MKDAFGTELFEGDIVVQYRYRMGNTLRRIMSIENGVARLCPVRNITASTVSGSNLAKYFDQTVEV